MTALANKVKYEDARQDMAHRYQLHEDDPESFDVYMLTGKAIERMQVEAKKICNLLSRAYGFRLLELVADFVKDRHDTYWLVNVKSFVLEEHNYGLKVKEHEHLIENQNVILDLLREEANDSSMYRLMD